MLNLTQPSGKGALVCPGWWIVREAVPAEGRGVYLPWPAGFPTKAPSALL